MSICDKITFTWVTKHNNGTLSGGNAKYEDGIRENSIKSSILIWMEWGRLEFLWNKRASSEHSLLTEKSEWNSFKY